MSLQLDEIRSEIEKTLEILSEKKGIEFTAKIRSILYANLDRGRVQTFIEDDMALVMDYMWRVVDNYQRLNELLHQLQVERVNEIWENLLRKMEKWAYWFLLRNGYPEVKTTWEDGRECASEAASKLLRAYFPFDTEFEPWAHVIVQNVCRKFIRKSAKNVLVTEESYDTLEDELKSLTDTTLLTDGNQNDVSAHLMEAVEQLTPLRREVILLKYFQGASPTEIAEKLGKGIRAVYSLQFHAILDLRNILMKNRDKLNE